MEQNKTSPKYKSPARKLVVFFEKSRDKWKAKYQEIKITVKRLQNRIRFLETSKAQLKIKIKELEKANNQLQKDKDNTQNELEYLKKKLLREK